MSAFMLAAEEGGFNPLSVETGLYVWTTIAFLTVLFLLAKKVLPKLEEGLADREAKIKEDIERAEQLRAEAEQLEQETKARLDAASEEGRKVAAEIAQAAEASRQESLTRVQQEIEALRAKALAQIQAEVERAKSQMRPEIGKMAVQIASTIVEKELDENAHRQLVDNFIKDLDKQGASS